VWRNEANSVVRGRAAACQIVAHRHVAMQHALAFPFRAGAHSPCRSRICAAIAHLLIERLGRQGSSFRSQSLEAYKYRGDLVALGFSGLQALQAHGELMP
jgi:hypothetical protein